MGLAVVVAAAAAVAAVAVADQTALTQRRPTMTRLLLVLSVAATLAGCATAPAPGPAVTAPIPFSATALDRYKTWLNTPYPAYFALSRDGQHAGYSYCKYHPDCGMTAEDALTYCRFNSSTENGGCVIYAVNGRPVIQDPALASALGRGTK